MENLYKQAIVDAKAVRASAIANAKATLQEAIEPQIQRMMRLKLSEDLEEMDDMANEDIYSERDDVVDESTLDEILDELNSLDEENAADELEESFDGLEEDEDEGEGDDDDDSEDDDEGEVEDDEEEGEEAEEVEDEVSDETKIVDITLGDLKQVLQSMNAAEQVSADDMDIADMEMDPDAMGAEVGDDEEFGGDDEETISLDEILAELEKDGLEEDAEIEKMEEKKDKEEDEDLKEKVDKMEEELEEAQDAIITLNETLKELNLLNAKLLFANKILRAKTLSESEKSRVIKAFDRTKTVKETKNTYNTLMESFTKKPKTQIKESIGFASKPAGVAPKTSNAIVESDGFIDRWKVIAGIK